jgi:hypothetical protein
MNLQSILRYNNNNINSYTYKIYHTFECVMRFFFLYTEYNCIIIVHNIPRELEIIKCILPYETTFLKHLDSI